MPPRHFYVQLVVAGGITMVGTSMLIKATKHYGHKEKMRRTFEDRKLKVAVIGAGYAGRAFVKDINVDMFDVVIIDKNLKIETDTWFDEKVNKIMFEPQPNYVDSLSDNKMVTNYQVLPKGISDIQGEVVAIEKEKQLIRLKDKTIIPYDYLVVATGSIPDTFNVKMNYSCDNNMWYYFKDSNDVKALMTAINIVGLDDVVVMGGGITGVELASELSKKIEENKAKNPTSTPTKSNPYNVTILEPSDRLLPKLRPSISQEVTERLQKQKINIITNANIQEINSGTIKLVHNGNEDMTLKAVIAVWTCGVKPDELVQKWFGTNVVNKNLMMRLKSNEDKRIENVYAIGDCNQLLPKSAQHSKQQGAYLAEYFNSMGPFDFDAKGFKFIPQGQMIRLSDGVYMDSPVYTGMLPLFVHRAIIELDI